MRKLFLGLLLLAALGSAALFALWFAIGTPAEGIHLIVNDQEVDLTHLSGWHAAVAGAAALLVLCAVAVALPLALLLAVLLPLLLVLGVLMIVFGAALGIGALALAPAVLPLLLLWWLWRRSRRAAAATGSTGATPAS
jgi:hypothetical protein